MECTLMYCGTHIKNNKIFFKNHAHTVLLSSASSNLKEQGWGGLASLCRVPQLSSTVFALPSPAMAKIFPSTFHKRTFSGRYSGLNLPNATTELQENRFYLMQFKWQRLRLSNVAIQTTGMWLSQIYSNYSSHYARREVQEATGRKKDFAKHLVCLALFIWKAGTRTLTGMHWLCSFALGK